MKGYYKTYKIVEAVDYRCLYFKEIYKIWKK